MTCKGSGPNPGVENQHVQEDPSDRRRRARGRKRGGPLLPAISVAGSCRLGQILASSAMTTSRCRARRSGKRHREMDADRDGPAVRPRAPFRRRRREGRSRTRNGLDQVAARALRHARCRRRRTAHRDLRGRIGRWFGGRRSRSPRRRGWPNRPRRAGPEGMPTRLAGARPPSATRSRRRQFPVSTERRRRHRRQGLRGAGR